jgi:hypothetical protein
MKVFMYLLLISVFVAGCAANTKRVACDGKSWTQLGYQMGANGKSLQEFHNYKSNCSKNLESLALKSYLDGYARGIVEFCTFKNGYALGYTQSAENVNCPPEIEAEFKKGFAEGKRVMDNHLRRIDKAINTRPRNGFRM